VVGLTIEYHHPPTSEETPAQPSRVTLECNSRAGAYWQNATFAETALLGDNLYELWRKVPWDRRNSPKANAPTEKKPAVSFQFPSNLQAFFLLEHVSREQPGGYLLFPLQESGVDTQIFCLRRPDGGFRLAAGSPPLLTVKIGVAYAQHDILSACLPSIPPTRERRLEGGGTFHAYVPQALNVAPAFPTTASFLALIFSRRLSGG
jgi:hypothetical protein